MAETLAEIMVELLAGGVFDGLPEKRRFAELSQSRIGYGADAKLAGFLVDELRQRGLARPSEDGVSIPLHPVVRTTILVILGQLARRAGARRGMAVHPATNCPKAATDLLDALSRESMPSCEGVIRLDLEPVTLDLSAVPLEEVLQLRDDHREAHRAYMRSLRGFLVELGRLSDPVEREAAILERRQEIADMAHDNRCSVGRSVGKSLTSWSMGIAGGVWSAANGDLLGTAVGALGLGADLVPGSADTVGTYSYLFAATSAFGQRVEWLTSQVQAFPGRAIVVVMGVVSSGQVKRNGGDMLFWTSCRRPDTGRTSSPGGARRRAGARHGCVSGRSRDNLSPDSRCCDSVDKLLDRT